MDNYKEQLEVEIVKTDIDNQEYEVTDDLIEFAPEDVEFEQYEYIEVEECQETKIIANKWKVYQNKVSQNQTVNQHRECDETPINTEDMTLIIKLETDQQYHDFREKMFQCSNRKCKREVVKFETQHELYEHNVMHLMQINANECPLCNKILANQNKLQHHMETRHIRKNLTCDNCGRIFRSKDNLRLHMSHHRKHFIVECRACNKTYKSMQSLRYHLRQHFEHHQCETCGTVSKIFL